MKTSRIIVSLLALFISVRPTIAQDIDEAKELIENKRYESAEKILEQNIAQAAPQPEVNYLLVKTYLDQDKTSEAGDYVNKYLGTSNPNPLNRVAYARYLLNKGEKDAAINLLNGIVLEKKNQKDPQLLLAMAEVMIDEDNGDANLALQWLALSNKRDKHNADIDVAKGRAYRKLSDGNNAFLSFRQAIKEDPDNLRAYYQLGKIFTAQKNPDVYLEYFNKAYAIDSTYAPVLKELYNHYYYRDIAQAKRYLRKYIANTDPTVENEYQWTDILYLNKEYPKAISSAKLLIANEASAVKPRLYKLIAYSYAKSGDSATAYPYMKEYFEKEEAAKLIAADFDLMARLSGREPGSERAAIDYFAIAAEMDTVMDNKVDYARAIVELYKKTGDQGKQAEWLGKIYRWKESPNNIDLFNWGLAHYMAKQYPQTDTVFLIYTMKYPEDIYGYYWRAQANASIDTSMAAGLAIPFYMKVVEIGEKDSVKNKKMLLKAYGYLGGYEANVTKNYQASLNWFEKYLAMEENADVNGYVEMLRKWIAEKK